MTCFAMQWLEKEETWTREEVQAYDNGAEPRNLIMVSAIMPTAII